ncbi:MAG TPA: PHB depolymerase family esterase [Pyrinomonadaceae bacterium]|jgi:poly(hydroxyalkanoate) depolymerase family esterase|nr:PHB depolymerase family esterase [Pyrinomonadaceae bacterium]
MRHSKHFIILTFVLLLLVLPVAARAGSWTSGSVTNASGSRVYKLWIPAGYTGKAGLPLVMMLHGCTQTPDDFAAATGMNSIADRNDFLVVYPEETAGANALKCWNWFDSAHQSRGQGEPSLLALIVNQVRADFRVDGGRVYVAGFSAGGAMAVIMGATYPDLFAAIGIHSGIAYKAATNLKEARPAMAQGGADAARLGQLAYEAMANTKHTMRVILFQGAKDGLVAPVNADRVITQWAQADDYIDDGKDNESVDDVADKTTESVSAGGYAYKKSIYNDRNGKPLIEGWVIQELKHAWSGGVAGASYTDPKGPDASQEMWRFFRESKPLPQTKQGNHGQQRL